MPTQSAISAYSARPRAHRPVINDERALENTLDQSIRFHSGTSLSVPWSSMYGSYQRSTRSTTGSSASVADRSPSYRNRFHTPWIQCSAQSGMV